MKAVVVDIADNYAVVMSSSGEFIKIRNTGDLQVGYETEIPSVRIFNGNIKRLSSIAAIFLFIVFSGIGVYSYITPYSYVNIDINPSIEIATNIYDRIINVTSLNDDGQELIVANHLDTLHNKKIDVGIEIVLKDVAKAGYFADEEKNAVIFAVSSKDAKKADTIETNVQNVVAKEIKAKKTNTAVVVEKVDIKKHDDAKTAGISPGKMILIEKLQENEPEAKLEDYKDKPVKEILKSIQPYGYYGISTNRDNDKKQQNVTGWGAPNTNQNQPGRNPAAPNAGNQTQSQNYSQNSQNYNGWGLANPWTDSGKNSNGSAWNPTVSKARENKKEEKAADSKSKERAGENNQNNQNSTLWGLGKAVQKENTAPKANSKTREAEKKKEAAVSDSKTKARDEEKPKQNTDKNSGQKAAGGDKKEDKKSGQDNKDTFWNNSWWNDSWPFKR